GGAAAILARPGVAPQGGEGRAEKRGEHVGAARRRERNDEVDRVGGKDDGLRARGRDPERRRKRGGGGELEITAAIQHERSQFTHRADFIARGGWPQLV